MAGAAGFELAPIDDEPLMPGKTTAIQAGIASFEQLGG